MKEYQYCWAVQYLLNKHWTNWLFDSSSTRAQQQITRIANPKYKWRIKKVKYIPQSHYRGQTDQTKSSTTPLSTNYLY